ncbi:hypothetical protein V2I01_37860 [Micromonospora sp. BRA006-A]|nr:hypothetical protein [Micromonospora sp. BRA006-A]
MLRALLVDTPDDPAAWTADLQYRLGPDLLVAPVLDPSGERAVYLPAGDDWLDAYTGQRHPAAGTCGCARPSIGCRCTCGTAR